MSSEADFRTRVLDTLTSAGVDLGTYHVPDVGATPAIWVGDPPEGTTIASGLEVLVGVSRKPTYISTFGGNVALKNWTLRIVNHGGGDLDAAMDAIDWAFSPGTPQFIDEVGDIAEQVVFTILAD